MSYWSEHIERGVGGGWGTKCGALWFAIRRRTAGLAAHLHRGSSPQIAGLWVGRGGDYPGGAERGSAAPSGTQRHHEDSVDNEQSLWCVLQGLVKAEPGSSNEALASVWSYTDNHRQYKSTSIVLHADFFPHIHCSLIRFHTFLHIILHLILIMEIRSCLGAGCILKYI